MSKSYPGAGRSEIMTLERHSIRVEDQAPASNDHRREATAHKSYSDQRLFDSPATLQVLIADPILDALQQIYSDILDKNRQIHADIVDKIHQSHTDIVDKIHQSHTDIVDKIHQSHQISSLRSVKVIRTCSWILLLQAETSTESKPWFFNLHLNTYCARSIGYFALAVPIFRIEIP